jgi:hypothetical protein
MTFFLSFFELLSFCDGICVFIPWLQLLLWYFL